MGWWRQLLRAMGMETEVAKPPAQGANAGSAAAPTFSVTASLSAFVQFPWVRACLDAIGDDLTRLPLVIRRGPDGPTQERMESIPGLSELLTSPTSWQTREEWERTLLIHLLLTGNAFCLLVGLGRPTSIPLLHPNLTRVVPGVFGGPESYEFQAAGDVRRYSTEIVQHWRLAAWEQGDQGMIGEGLIRALTADLNADLNAARMSAAQARQGRPAAVFSPANEGDIWDEDVRKQVVAAYTRIVEANAPAMALSGGVKVEFPSLTPRDMEYSESRTLTRETVLAAFGVPPTRVGLPTANYATAKEENKIYWGKLIGLAAMIDAGLTRIARRFDPSLSVVHDFSQVEALQEGRDSRLNRVVTWTMLGASAADAAAYEGFSDAPVAMPEQPAQAAKRVNEPAQRFLSTPITHLSLLRAIDPDQPRLEDSEYERPPYEYVAELKRDYPQIWDAGGNIRGDEAFQYWGKYVDGDRSESVLAWVREREAWAARHYEDGDAFTGESPESPTLSNIGGVVAWLKWGVVGQLGWDEIRDLIDALKDTQDAEKSIELERVAIWRGWLDEIHSPAEASLAIHLRRALAVQADKVADALADHKDLIEQRGLKRDLAELLSGLVDAIFPKEIQDLMAWMTRQAYQAGLRSAFRVAARQVGATLSVERADPLVEQLLASMVGNVNTTTRDMLAQILADGIAEGATVSELQRRIRGATGFSASRSLLVARTETTRSVNAGSSYAWQLASADGDLVIEREWLSARDSETRDAHRELDGQVAPLGGFFTISTGEHAGKKASGPGEFDHPALVCNCRCTLLPRIKK
jgi:HK97 family phage portal protein